MLTADQETAMFGETISEMKTAKPVYYGNDLYAMAILSDVQELLARGDRNLEVARRWINKAKFFISDNEAAAKLMRAAQVITNTAQIRGYLEQHDPTALAQLEAAILEGHKENLR